jgi:Fe-S-cluster containining protein
MIDILEDVDKWECDYKDCDAICCTEGLQLTIGDIERISALGKKWREFAVFDEESRTFRLKGVHGRCIFLDKDLSCNIHDSRPLICRLLPFRIVDVVYSDMPIMKLKPTKVCPGYGKGPSLNSAFKQKIESVATQFIRENQKLIRELSEKGTEAVLGEL